MGEGGPLTKTDVLSAKAWEQTGLDTHSPRRKRCRLGGCALEVSELISVKSTAPGAGRKVKTQNELDGGPHKRWSMWFNSMQR